MAIFGKPKYSTVKLKKKDIPEGLWKKCPVTGDIVYIRDLEQNLMVVPKSGYHFPLAADARIASMVDEDTWEQMDDELVSVDVLGFKGVASYKDKLQENRKKTGYTDAVLCGVGEMGGIPVSLAVMDFRFLGASMGSVVGEKVTRTVERALERKIPCVVVSASGGARMYEGILSLMQMAKTSAALGKLSEEGLPFISVLTHPTMAGVMASYASLGDVILAEPGALVGFAGPRVVKDTTQQPLPEGFQTAEFLWEHGLIDQIVSRLEMRDRLISLLRVLYAEPRAV